MGSISSAQEYGTQSLWVSLAKRCVPMSSKGFYEHILCLLDVLSKPGTPWLTAHRSARADRSKGNSSVTLSGYFVGGGGGWGCGSSSSSGLRGSGSESSVSFTTRKNFKIFHY